MKQTKKEIEETLRNKLVHKHNQDVEHYKERISKLVNENYDLRKRYQEKSEEVLELKEKVEQYEDWIHRLQEFMDMNEEDRKTAMAEAKFHEELGGMLDMYKRFTGMFFN